MRETWVVDELGKVADEVENEAYGTFLKVASPSVAYDYAAEVRYALVRRFVEVFYGKEEQG